MKISFQQHLHKGVGVLLTACFLYMYSTAYSGTFNQWQTAHIAHKSGTDILTSGNHFIYHTLNNGVHQVVSLNLDLREEKVLLTDNDEEIALSSNFYELANGQVIMVARYFGNDTGSQIFHTDGEQPFEALTTRNIKLMHRPLVNGYYFYYHNSDLVWTDGVTTQRQPLESNDGATPLCVYDMEHVVFAKGSNGFTDIYNYTQGQATQVLPGYSVDGNRIHANVAEFCLVKVKGSDEQYRIAHLGKNGDVELTNRNDSKYEIFNGNFVAFTAPASAMSSPVIQLLDSQNLNVINGISFNSTEFIEVYFAGGRVIYSRKDNFRSEALISLLDNEFNLIGTNFVVDDYFASTRSEDYFLRGGKVISTDNLQENKGILLEGNNPTYNPDSDYILTDTSESLDYTGHEPTEFYVYEDQVAIGPLLSGAWIDTEMPNQGASINPGVRQDGSHYVFLAFYLFREGQPLWLAGIADYVPGDGEISMVLSEYEGANYLDFINTPDRTTFGEIKLHFSSCNTIDATFSYGETLAELDWVRIDDMTFAKRCQ